MIISFLGGIAESDFACCDALPYHGLSVCMYVCVSSVTLVLPAKLVGRNEMSFNRHSSVVRGNIAVDGAAVFSQEEEICGWNQ